MQLDKFIIALILVSAITLTLGGAFFELSSNYGLSVDDRYTTTFNKFNETSKIAEDITLNIKPAAAREGSGSDADLGDMYKSAISIIKVTFFQGIPASFSMITNLGSFIPIPAYLITSIQAILLVMLCFAAFYLYLRYKN